MAIFVVGDLHLSLGGDKPMDVFEGWEGYLPKLEANWRTLISPQDTVILAGDTSWAMKLEDTKTDFAFIQNLPGQKWLLKGNHDYWWTTARKMERYLTENGFDTMHILHNNACMVGDYALCGTRGWPFDDTNAQDAKIMAREAGRLRMSLQAGGSAQKIAFLHYPPVYPGGCARRISATHNPSSKNRNFSSRYEPERKSLKKHAKISEIISPLHSIVLALRYPRSKVIAISKKIIVPISKPNSTQSSRTIL